jgi:phosphoribosylamine--glycine ligase
MSAGGRVLSITSYGKDLTVALRRSYETAEKIEFENAYYRKDIGFDVL